ncbi:hypothetical protein D3C73_798320 [compost metagenome]
MKADDLTESAALNQLPRQVDDRVVLVVVADTGDHAGILGRQVHGIGLFKAHRQRFFAVHRLASGNSGHGHGVVQVVGCGDGDQVDLGVVDQLLPVAIGLLKAPGGGTCLGTDGIGVGQGGEAKREGQFECCADVAKGQGMGTAHEACADKSDSEFAHDRILWIFVFRDPVYRINIPFHQLTE